MTRRLANYIKQQYVMQLATLSNGRPWNCTVYYVADERLNLYWASLPSRRHSREIAVCENVAIAIVIEHEIGQKVVGLQASGTARIVENSEEIKLIAKKYAGKFGRDDQWAEDFSHLRTKHRLYKFTPESYVLFDEQNFPEDPRQEIRLNDRRHT